jgi:hypothetical protein
MVAAALVLLLGGSPVFQMSDADLDAYLAGLHAQGTGFESRFAEVVADTVGTPYHSGPLGEGPGAKYDPDPLADFTRVDCVTFVEQSLALAVSASRDEAVERLQRIRYKDGVVDYESRNHFMETDWFPNNPFCRNVTAELGVETDTATRTISRKDFFRRVKAPELGQDTPDAPLAVDYVPTRNAAAAEPRLPSPAIVCFVGKVDWLFTTHCGIYLRDTQGKGRLYHASVTEKKVVATGLADYLRQNERFLGFTAWKIDEPAAATAPRR